MDNKTFQTIKKVRDLGVASYKETDKNGKSFEVIFFPQQQVFNNEIKDIPENAWPTNMDKFEKELDNLSQGIGL